MRGNHLGPMKPSHGQRPDLSDCVALAVRRQTAERAEQLPIGTVIYPPTPAVDEVASSAGCRARHAHAEVGALPKLFRGMSHLPIARRTAALPPNCSAEATAQAPILAAAITAWVRVRPQAFAK